MTTITYKIDLGTKGAKSEMEQVKLDYIEEVLEEQEYLGVHEVATGEVIPFFDYDRKVQTEEEFKQLRYETIEKADQEIRKLFPKARVMFLESSGKSADCWKIGGHWKVRDHGCYPSSLDIKELWKRLPEAMRSDPKNGFDGQIYGKNRSLRMPYTAKPSDPERILKRAEINREKKTITVLELTQCDVLGEDYGDWLHTNVDGEKKRKTLIKDEPEQEVKEEAAEPNQHNDTEATVREWVEAVSATRACNEDSCTHVIWAIAEKAKQMGIDLEPLAQEFAKKTTADNYNEVWVTGQYHRSKGAIKFGSLVKWACEDSPNAAVVKRHLEKKEAAKPEDPNMEIPISFYEDKYELLKKEPSVKEIRHWMIGCLAYVEELEQWYLRFRAGWKKLPKCPKKFPFTTMSSESHIITQVPGPKGKDGKVAMVDKKTYFSEILEKLKDEPIFDRCRYIKQEYVPYFKEAPKKIFNTWGGWINKFCEEKVTEDKPKLKRVLELLYDLCGRDAKMYNWFLGWLAKLIQHPTEKLPLVLFYSRLEGVAKGILIEFLNKYVLGEHNVFETTDLKQLVGHFNAANANNLLVVCEEAKDDGKGGDIDVMKNLISSYKLAVQKKGEEAEMGRNLCKYLYNTNNKHALGNFGSGTRRHGLNRCYEGHSGDLEYFEKLVDDIHNPEAGEQFFNYLAQYDLSNFRVWSIPDNDFKDELKLDDLPSALEHIRQICEGKREQHKLSKGPLVIGMKELYADYRNFCVDEGIGARYVMLQKRYKERICDDLGILYDKFKLEDGTRMWGVELDRAALEKAFQKHLKKADLKFAVDTDSESEEADE